jgi:hypothetical protein
MVEVTTDISRIKPATGYVIIEVPYLTKESKDNMDLALLADVSIGDFTVRSGIILSCGSTDIPGANFMWSSPLHVKKGDQVWWVPNASQQLANTEDEQYRVMRHQSRLFITIPYKMLVMKIENGEYVGLNDYVITEIMDEEGVEFGSVHKVVGVPAEGIIYHDTLDETPVKVEKGMTVLLRKPRKMYLEHENDMELPGRFSVFQSRMIVGQVTI